MLCFLHEVFRSCFQESIVTLSTRYAIEVGMLKARGLSAIRLGYGVLDFERQIRESGPMLLM